MPRHAASLIDDAGQPSTSREIVAMLSKRDFAAACLSLSGFEKWASYEEFQMERDGAFLTAVSAGADVLQIDASLSSFLKWSRLTGAPKSLIGLDDFASRIWWREARPQWPVAVRLGDRFQLAEAPAGSCGEISVPLDIGILRRWTRQLGQLGLQPTSGSTLLYAQLVAEVCLSKPQNAEPF